MHEVWSAWYTFNTLQKTSQKSISPGMQSLFSFKWLQTCFETVIKWLNGALEDNYIHRPPMGSQHLHCNYERRTDDHLPVTCKECLTATTGRVWFSNHLTSSITICFCCSSTHTRDNSSVLSSASCPSSKTHTEMIGKMGKEGLVWTSSSTCAKICLL